MSTQNIPKAVAYMTGAIGSFLRWPLQGAKSALNSIHLKS